MKNKILNCLMLVVIVGSNIPFTNVALYASEVREGASVDLDSSHETVEETPLTDDQLVDMYNLTYSGFAGSTMAIPDQSAVNYDVPGTYPVKFSIIDYGDGSNNMTVESQLIVTDVKPSMTFTSSNVSAHVGMEPDYIDKFGVTATEITSGDLNDTIVIDDSSVDFNTVGKYPVTFTATDEEGNSVSKTGNISFSNKVPDVSTGSHTSIPEETVPTVDEYVDLLGIVATDDDGIGEIIIDDSAVDYSTPGDYVGYVSATDIYGAESTKYTVNIEVTDVLPTISLTNDEVHVNPADTPDYISLFGPIATEITDGDLNDVVTVDSSSVDLNTPGEYSVIFSVTDEEGNPASITGTVVVDYSAPTITVDSEATIREEDPQTKEELKELFNFDYTSSIEATVSVDDTAVDYSTPGDYSVVFTVSDSHKDLVSKTVTLHITDLLPTISTKTDLVSAHVGVERDYIEDFEPVATEIISGDINDTLEIDDSAVDINKVGKYPVVFTAHDNEGNSVSKTVTLSLKNEVPTLSASTHGETPEGTTLTVEDYVDIFSIEASDKDGIGEILVDDSSVDYNTPGEYDVYFSATDIYGGESSSHKATLTVTDVLPSIELTNNDIHVDVASSPDYISLFGPIATEITEGDITDSVTVDSSSVDLNTPGEYTVIFTATDDEDNEVSAEGTLIVDYEPPTITVDSEATIREEDPQTKDELKELFNFDYTSSIAATVGVDDSDVDYDTPGDYSVVFTVSDSHKDLVSKTVTLHITDLLPRIDVKSTLISAHVGIERDYISDFGVVATEIISGDIDDTIEIDDSAVDINTVGRYPVIFTAHDNEGNYVSKEVTLSLKDDVPVVTADTHASTPEGTELSVDEYVDLFNVEATDPDGIKDYIIDDSAVDYNTPGDYDVYISATDIYNAESSKHKVTLTVTDVLPTLKLDNLFTIKHVGSEIDLQSEFGPIATEITDGDLTSKVVIDDSSVNYDEVGRYPVIFTVTDDEGNEVSKTGVLILTNDSPEITVDSEASINEGTTLTDSELIDLFNVVIEDTDSIASIKVDSSSVDFSTPGSYYVSFTAVDEYGKESDTEYAKLIVEDVLPTLETDIDTYTIHVGESIDFVSTYGAVGTELINGDLTDEIIVDDSSVDYNTAGTYEVVLTVSDDEGNKVSKTIDLVIENDNPVVTASDVTTPEGTMLTDEELLEMLDVVATDSDEIASITVDSTEVDYNTVGTYPVTVTAIDEFGGVTEVTNNVEVTDVLPTIDTDLDSYTTHIGSAVDYLTVYGAVATEITEGDLTSSIEIDDSSVNYNAVGTYPVTLTVSDDEGNEVSKTIELVVENDDPQVTASDIETPEGTVLTDEELLEKLEVIATDTDTISSITVDSSELDYNTPGDYTVNITVTDEFGAETTITAVVTVTDELPTIKLSDKIAFMHVGAEVNLTDLFGPIATEIIESDLTSEIIIDDSAVDYDSVGTYPVIFTVTDDEGNTTSAKGILVITDDSPEITVDSEATIKEGSKLSDQDLLHLFNVVIEDTDDIASVDVDSSAVDFDTPGTYYVGFTAVDEYGKESDTEYAKLIVEDVLPTIDTDIDSYTLHIGDSIDYVSAYGAVASELVDGDITSTIVANDSSVDYTSTGIYDVVLTATDDEGNEVSKTVELVIENDSPKITATNITIAEEMVLTDEQLLTKLRVEVSDKDTISSLTVDSGTIDYHTPGEYIVTITAVDEFGAKSSIDALVEITDLLPTIVTDTDSYTTHVGNEIDYMDTYGVIASEIVKDDLTSSVSIDDSDVDYNTPGTYDVIFTVTDEEGNTTDKTVQLIVENDSPIVTANDITIPEETVLSDDELLEMLAIEVTDTDIISSTGINSSSIDYSTPGNYEVEIHVTDEYGATTSIVATVEVTDLLPTISVESNIVRIHIGTDIDLINLFGATATEITEGDLTSSIEIDDSSVDYSATGVYPVVFSVSDEEGNVASHKVRLLITDDAPEITVDSEASSPEGTKLSDQDLMHLFNVTVEDPDGISSVEVDSSMVDFNTPGTYYVGFTAIDEYGKASATEYVELTIEDVLPVINIENDEVTVEVGTKVDIMSDFGITATELVDGDLTAEVTIDDSNIDYNKPGTYEIVVTVSDDEGNIVSETIKLIITETNEVITEPEDNTDEDKDDVIVEDIDTDSEISDSKDNEGEVEFVSSTSDDDTSAKLASTGNTLLSTAIILLIASIILKGLNFKRR